MINITTATSAELLAFFNANTGGAQVKKFADRKTAERRVSALVQEMAEEYALEMEPNHEPAAYIEHAHQDNVDAAYREIAAREAEAEGEGPFITDLNTMREEASHPYGYTVHGHDNCPHCGIHLSNGVGEDGQEVNGKAIKHDAFQYECLGCGAEFGPAVVRKSAPVSTGVLRPAMAASLKIDRQIVEVSTGVVYANACQVWKAGLVSASQGDRLSAVLYGAAKAGNRLMSVTVNGHVFALAVK